MRFVLHLIPCIVNYSLTNQSEQLGTLGRVSEIYTNIYHLYIYIWVISWVIYGNMGYYFGNTLPCKIFTLPKESPFLQPEASSYAWKFGFRLQRYGILDACPESRRAVFADFLREALEGIFCWKCTGKTNSEDVYGTCWVGWLWEFLYFCSSCFNSDANFFPMLL